MTTLFICTAYEEITALNSNKIRGFDLRAN